MERGFDSEGQRVNVVKIVNVVKGEARIFDSFAIFTLLVRGKSTKAPLKGLLRLTKTNGRNGRQIRQIQNGLSDFAHFADGLSVNFCNFISGVETIGIGIGTRIDGITGKVIGWDIGVTGRAIGIRWQHANGDDDGHDVSCPYKAQFTPVSIIEQLI